LFGDGIELVLTLQRPLAPSHADRDTVRQVLLNLWKNAAEALPPGSRIVTATTDHVYRDGRVYTQLSVSDNGPGLPADVMRTPFQPLGMNRRPGRSGLGLSIVQSLVAGLAGHVSCQTAPGRGTRFEVLFPQGISAQAAGAGGDAA
jgi:nitrogen-specific signal transduction histidine kinase